MAYNDRTTKRDAVGNLVAQHFSDEINDYEPVKGSDGATHVKQVNPIPAGNNVIGKVTIDSSEQPLKTKAETISDFVTGAITITSLPVELKVGSQSLPGRKQLILHPPDVGVIYWGKSTVTLSTGSPLSAGQFPIIFDVDDSSPKIYAVSDGTNRSIRVVEIS